MFSILWYSLFAFLSGFSTSYGMLFACRALFGIGMGGVWAAGMPLAIEHWPPHLRGLASGLLQGGYAMGYLLSAVVFQFVYPAVADRADGWRILLWLGVLPSLLAFWVMAYVRESPVWLARQEHLKDTQRRDTFSLGRLFTRDLLATTIHTSLLMATLLFLYNSITYWYPQLIGQMGRQVVPFMMAFNAAAIIGAIGFGRLSETSIGRRGAAAVATLLGVVSTPLFLFGGATGALIVGAAAMGLGTGNFGIVPGYLNERFPTAVRAVGAGFAYQVGAALASVAPYFIGALTDRGIALSNAMAVCIAMSGVAVMLLLWLGPETRGRSFQSTH
jgi:MFS family permease